jgi:hypothetical protein
LPPGEVHEAYRELLFDGTTRTWSLGRRIDMGSKVGSLRRTAGPRVTRLR